MNLFPKHIKLNGKDVVISELLKNSTEKSELIDFIKEWHSTESFVEVKTSGSTGTPKKIQLEKEFVAESALRTIRFFQLKKGDRVLHCLPVKYIAGKLMIVRALIGELDLHIVSPETDFSVLQTEKFKFAAMVPAQVIKILNAEPSYFKNLDQLLIGGSAIPLNMEKQLQKVSTACHSSYAMTETATHIALRKINGTDSDKFYHCLDDIQVQLSEEKCLQILMPGLAKQQLQTTDLAELIDEKTFRILGRNDNVIISGGIKYSPEQLEKKLEPYIEIPFQISSIPHESLGEQLVLVLEENENDKVENEIENICQKQLSKYEQPRQIVFIQHFPKTKNGKIDRNQLNDMIKNYI